MLSNLDISNAMTIKLSNELPPKKEFQKGIRRAPNRGYFLSKEETVLALKNALRYIPEELHDILAPEFLEELRTMGRIYGYRYRPEGRIYGKPIDEYKGTNQRLYFFQLASQFDSNAVFEIKQHLDARFLTRTGFPGYPGRDRPLLDKL